MATSDKNKKVLAFVVYPGTPPLDVVGSWQFLGALAMKKGYELVVVAERLEPVETDTPLKIVPDKIFAEVPYPHGLLVMGGGDGSVPAAASEALLAYVRTAGEAAEVVASIGTGSLILAAAGLLADRRATTHWACGQALEEMGVSYLRQRYVEDGKFLTAAGDTAGIDMALYLLSKMADLATVRFHQLWAEYDPQPPFGSINWNEADGKLLARPSTSVNHADKKRIAFVIYPGLTVFDLVGPLQVLSRLTTFAPQYETVVVAERMGPVKSDSRLTFLPDKTFTEVPHPFAFVVPGGALPTLQAMSNPAIRHYIRTAAETADIISSVCTGALLLASVGLLQGREVPTHWAYKNVLESYGTRYVRKRWVEDGKLIVSAGVSAGIDSALLMATRLTDEVTARKVQLSLEYDPQPPFGGIDYDDLNLQSQLLKGALSLTAPLFTFRPKRLTRRERRFEPVTGRQALT